MTTVSGVILCLSFIVGLLSTGLPWRVAGLPVGAIALIFSGCVASVLVPKYWRTGPRSRLWLIAGFIGLIAVLYFEICLPKPGANDVSRLIPASDAIASELVFTVKGKIDSQSHLTRSGKIQFWLQTTQAGATTKSGAKALAERATTGRVYATVPLLIGTGLHSGQGVSITGLLYKPKPAANPSGFDFQAYLAQEGGFAGLNGKQVEILKDSPWGLWAVRQRIVRSQVRWLGVPEGPLLSAMVMGKNSVDVPYDLRDQFAKAGLAHALAASGFQVSLLVGVLLKMTQRLAGRLRLGIGTAVLALYLGLTGGEPSVLRAGVMGFAVLLSMTLERKIKPLGSLLIAALFLLVLHPIWIWNLGFQLSFLATIGLLVTAPVLTRWLDWLPPTIATFIAVPMAAYLWTIPLQLHVFGVTSFYSIPVNAVTALLLTLISIGGMISALAALVYPIAGSATAWLLQYPIQVLIAIVEFCNQLPGNSFAVGTITVPQTIALYSLMGLIWWQSKLQRYWWVAGVIGLSFIAVPVGYVYTNLVQVTVLTGDPVLVLQDKGKVALINSGSESNAMFSILPFLRQQGANGIDWAIATHHRLSDLEGWFRIVESLPIKVFYDISSNHDVHTDEQATLNHAIFDKVKRQHLSASSHASTRFNSSKLTLIYTEPPVLHLQLPNETWLLLGNLQPSEQQQLIAANVLPTGCVVWWFGQSLTPELLEVVKPKVAIASSKSIDPNTIAWFKQQSATLYQTEKDGAIQWTQRGFKSMSLDERA